MLTFLAMHFIDDFPSGRSQLADQLRQASLLIPLQLTSSLFFVTYLFIMVVFNVAKYHSCNFLNTSTLDFYNLKGCCRVPTCQFSFCFATQIVGISYEYKLFFMKFKCRHLLFCIVKYVVSIFKLYSLCYSSFTKLNYSVIVRLVMFIYGLYTNKNQTWAHLKCFLSK